VTPKKEVVEDIVAALLKDDRSYCECRRSPFDGHDVNPPCETRIRVTKQVELTLEMAFPRVETGRLMFAIFPAGSSDWSDPLLGLDKRFQTREDAQTYLEERYSHPEDFEVRGRAVTGWSK
jgi:hypothetical protein